MKIYDQVFFVIDSDNLDKVKDKFIGFLIARDSDSIYENDEAKYPYGAFIDIHIGGGKDCNSPGPHWQLPLIPLQER